MYTPLIVDDPADPGRYDAEAMLVLDDWLDGIDGSSPEVTYRNLLAGGAGKADVTGMSGTDHDQMNMKIDLGDIAYPLHLVNGRTRQDPPTVTVPAGGC